MPLLSSFTDVSQLIDYRNRPIWEQVIVSLDVELKPSGSAEHGSFVQNKQATIFIPPHDLRPEGFSHELLHVYLFLKEVYVGQNMQMILASSNILSRIFILELTDHISNCLARVKMFPLYESMGYDPEMFLLDFNDHKCKLEEIKKSASSINKERFSMRLP